MNTPAATRLPHLGLAIVLGAAFFFAAFSTHSFASTCAGDANPCGEPYFKTAGGDVSTGGWFDISGTDSCDTSPTSHYQDASFSATAAGLPPDSQGRYGGILAYANSNSGNSAGGSSSEFAAYSAGEIAGNSSAHGFYSGGAQAKSTATPVGYLSFANSASTPPADFWAGLMVPPGGARQTSFCIPDYYGTMMAKYTTAPGALPGGTLNASTPFGDSATPVAYSENPSAGTNFDLVGDDDPSTGNSVSGADVSIPADAHITIFVKGSVFINHNITYAAGYTADNVPKFALVVEGSIYIDKSVTNLDGLYIAQPVADPANPSADLTADTGDIWTCRPEPYNYLSEAACNQKLVVNGAFIAKQVVLGRTNGDVGAATTTTAEDGFSSALGSNAGEVINYSPAMIIGGPFFGGSNPPVDSLVSLPPIF